MDGVIRWHSVAQRQCCLDSTGAGSYHRLWGRLAEQLVGILLIRDLDLTLRLRRCNACIQLELLS